MNKRNEMSILKTICIFISLACVCAFALVCVWEFGPINNVVVKNYVYNYVRTDFDFNFMRTCYDNYNK